MWKLAGDKEDPIRTDLHLFDDQLLFGTYSGKVFSVTVRQSQSEIQDPQSLIDQALLMRLLRFMPLMANGHELLEIYTGKNC